MGNNSVPKFIFRLSRFPVYRGPVLGRFYCIIIIIIIPWSDGPQWAKAFSLSRIHYHTQTHQLGRTPLDE